MPQCIARGAELEPPVRAPHTVYVKTLLPHRRPGLLSPPRHQGGLVNAAVVTEIKPGSGPVMAIPQGMSAAEP